MIRHAGRLAFVVCALSLASCEPTSVPPTTWNSGDWPVTSTPYASYRCISTEKLPDAICASVTFAPPFTTKFVGTG